MSEENDKKSNPYLYIFLRNDMKSMVPGRAAAQASHATSVFHHWLEETTSTWLDTDPVNEQEKRMTDYVNLINKWCGATPQGFGTTIVKGASLDEMEIIHGLAESAEIYADYIVDPDYVIKDGPVCFSGTVITGLVLFGRELLEDDSQLNMLISATPLF